MCGVNNYFPFLSSRFNGAVCDRQSGTVEMELGGIKAKVTGLNDCGSIMARVVCLGEFIFSPLHIVASPIFAIHSMATNKEARHTNCFWKVIDATITFITSPLWEVIYAIRALAGAIIHPGIIYKEAPPEQKAADARGGGGGGGGGSGGGAVLLPGAVVAAASV